MKQNSIMVELQNSTQGIYCNKSGKEICPLVLR